MSWRNLKNNTNKTIIACFHTRIDIAALSLHRGLHKGCDDLDYFFGTENRFQSEHADSTTCWVCAWSCALFTGRDLNVRSAQNSISHKKTNNNKQKLGQGFLKASFSFLLPSMYTLTYMYISCMVYTCIYIVLHTYVSVHILNSSLWGWPPCTERPLNLTFVRRTSIYKMVLINA